MRVYGIGVACTYLSFAMNDGGGMILSWMFANAAEIDSETR